MEDDNIIIILYVLVFIISVLAPVFKKKKKEDNARHNDTDISDTDIENNNIISQIVAKSRKTKTVEKQQPPLSPQKNFDLPEEGERITKTKPSPIIVIGTQNEELKKKKERLRNAIIYGEILSPKF